MANADARYRDFVYMDTGRIQSIIAQLEKGILDKVMEGKSKELQGKASAAAGVLASFLPIGLEGSFTRKTDTQESKVLHDYAFNMALEALDENDLYLEVEDWARDNLPLPDSAFILARGEVTILDYALLKNLADNEAAIDSVLGRSQNSSKKSPRKGRKTRRGKGAQVGPLQQMGILVDALMGEGVQVRLKYSDALLFAGPLSREYLREQTRDLIFKYGGTPQQDWVMLAQISQVTKPINKIAALTKLTESMTNLNDSSQISATTDIINPIIEVLNSFQEAMASVTYPAIAVTPIALYRELGSLK